MTRTTIILLLTILMFSLATGWAADNPVVGSWKCVSTDDAGQSYDWILTVKEDSGKLSGSLAGDPGEFPLVDPKVDGNTFSFKVVVNEASYSVEATVDGSKIEGKYKGPDANGTIKATKQQ